MTKRQVQDGHRQRILEVLVRVGQPAQAALVGRRVGRTSAQVSSLCRSLRGRGLLLSTPGPAGIILWMPTDAGQERGLQGLQGRVPVLAWLCACGAQVWTSSKPSRCPVCEATSSAPGDRPWARPILLEDSP